MLAIKQVVCVLSTPDRGLRFKAVLKFGDWLSYSFGISGDGSIILPGSLQGQEAVLDLWLFEFKAMEVIQVHVLSVRAGGKTYPRPPVGQLLSSSVDQRLTPVSKATAIPSKPWGTASRVFTNSAFQNPGAPASKPAAAPLGSSKTASTTTSPMLLMNQAVSSRNCLDDADAAAEPASNGVQPLPAVQKKISKTAYFSLMAHAIQQLLRTPAKSLPRLHESLRTVVASGGQLEKEVSEESFEGYLQAETSLFAVSREKVVSLQPAGLAFTERYLAICPVFHVFDRCQLAGDAALPVSEVPKHAHRAYRQLQVWTQLQVINKTCRAYFTFRADRQKIFYTYMKKPEDSATSLRRCCINIRMPDCGKPLLLYRFYPESPPGEDASSGSGQLSQLRDSQLSRMTTKPLRKNSQPERVGHRSRGRFSLVHTFSLIMI